MTVSSGRRNPRLSAPSGTLWPSTAARAALHRLRGTLELLLGGAGGAIGREARLLLDGVAEALAEVERLLDGAPDGRTRGPGPRASSHAVGEAERAATALGHGPGEGGKDEAGDVGDGPPARSSCARGERNHV